MKPHKQRKAHTEPTDDIRSRDSLGANAAGPTVASPSQQAPLHRELLRLSEVSRRTGRHRSSLWRDVQSGSMPWPVKIGPRAIAWYSDEIDAWISTRPRVRGNTE
jgi:prophage regulatory protein